MPAGSGCMLVFGRDSTVLLISVSSAEDCMGESV